MRDENPVMYFPIRKVIKFELFIDERAALYIQLNAKLKRV